MVKAVKKKKSFGGGGLGLKFIISSALLIIVMVTIPVYLFLVANPIDIRQRAAAPEKTATVFFTPQNGTFSTGQLFSINLIIDGGGQNFNAAQATVTIPSNLSVQSLVITPPNSGGCNFTFINANKTPSVSDASFAGAILGGGSTNRCTLYTLTLRGESEGTGVVGLSRVLVKSRAEHGEIFLSSTDGNYTITSIVTPTATPTTIPSHTPTPTNTPIPSPTVTVQPTQFPTPTSSPTPVVIETPTVNNYPLKTYESTLILSGGKNINVETVLINNSSVGISYPTNVSWLYSAQLAMGDNSYNIIGEDNAGNQSLPVDILIARHRVSDISGDGAVDLTDLSMFGVDWENTGQLNYELSDMNSDGVVDLADFSILAANYEL